MCRVDVFWCGVVVEVEEPFVYLKCGLVAVEWKVLCVFLWSASVVVVSWSVRCDL